MVDPDGPRNQSASLPRTVLIQHCQKPIRTDRLQLARDRPAAAQQVARRARRRRPTCAAWHFPGAEVTCATAGPARALPPAHHLRQPLRAMAEGECVESDDGSHQRRARPRHLNDRKHFYPGAPDGCNGRNMGSKSLSRSLPRYPHNEGRRRRRRARAADPARPDRRTGRRRINCHSLLDYLRPHFTIPAERGYDADLLREADPETGRHAQDPAEKQLGREALFHQAVFLPTQPCRAVPPHAETMSPGRFSLRQARR